MEQPVPKVTQGDVERIIYRDFGERAMNQVLSTIRAFYGHARLQLAILKLADGDLSELQKVVETAKADWRDILAYAEYPRYTREVGFSDTPGTVVNEIIKSDWEQYEQWLRRR